MPIEDTETIPVVPVLSVIIWKHAMRSLSLTSRIILLFVSCCAIANGQDADIKNSQASQSAALAIPTSLAPYHLKITNNKRARNDAADANSKVKLQVTERLVDLDQVPLDQIPLSQSPGGRINSTKNDRIELNIEQATEDDWQPKGQVQQVAGQTVLLPIETEPIVPNADLTGDQGLVTLVATGAELTSVLRLIADHHRMNLVIGPDVGGPVTVSIRGARLEEVLDAILGVAGFSWHQIDNLLYVTGSSTSNMDPRVQGRTLQVYPLNFVSASEIESVANTLLSPVGSAQISEADPANQLKTQEVLVVEDTAASHRRIAQYLAQIDVAPRQVLVEAHVLQVALTDENRHGINLRGLTDLDGSQITLEGSGFADENPTGPAVSLRVDGRDLQGLLDMIRSNTNSRTLASPKLSVVNHQEARIQIGQRLPFAVATTTQTSTIQSVEFLEVGVVLTVRPVITSDGRVLLSVLPKVSGGKITANGFPEEETTEVQTTILMPDGGGVIIGGLIREENNQSHASLPFAGKIPVLGHLFKRKTRDSRRNELIIALVTHVMSDGYGPRDHETLELDQTLPDYAAREILSPAPMIQYDH